MFSLTTKLAEMLPQPVVLRLMVLIQDNELEIT